MLNNGYQNLSLENIDISVGGTAANLKDALARILTNKIVILGDIVLSGEEKLPVGVECDISVSLSTEPDDWDPDVDGEFIPENIYSVIFKDVYGYDIEITDNEVVTTIHQSVVDSNIEDVAQDLIEGGTIDNAKPIYIHPIVLYKSGNLNLSLFIFDNSPEPYDTLAKVVDFAKNVAIAIGGNSNFPASGCYNYDGDFLIAGHIFATDGGSMSVSGMKSDGTQASFRLDNKTGISAIDGVNKIN